LERVREEGKKRFKGKKEEGKEGGRIYPLADRLCSQSVRRWRTGGPEEGGGGEKGFLKGKKKKKRKGEHVSISEFGRLADCLLHCPRIFLIRLAHSLTREKRGESCEEKKEGGKRGGGEKTFLPADLDVILPPPFGDPNLSWMETKLTRGKGRSTGKRTREKGESRLLLSSAQHPRLLANFAQPNLGGKPKEGGGKEPIEKRRKRGGGDSLDRVATSRFLMELYAFPASTYQK